MKQRGLLACLCLCFLLAACAADDPAPPVPGQVDLVLNVKGGQYQQVGLPLAKDDDGIVELTLAGINDDPKWAALANLCVQAELGGEQICLRFQNVARGSRQLQAKLITGTKTELLTSDDLPGDFAIGKAVKVDVHVSEGSVRFRIGGRRPITRTVPFSPRVLSLGCSSAACKARLT